MSDTSNTSSNLLTNRDLLLQELTRVGGPNQIIQDISGQLVTHAKKRYSLRKLTDIGVIVVHTTDADWTLEELASYDVGPNHISATGCPAITYSDVIMPDGGTFHTLPYNQIAWHVGPWNGQSVGVAMMYRCTLDDGRTDAYAPSQAAMLSLVQQCSKLCLKFGLTPDKVVGHRELRGTGWFMFKGHKRLRKTCPGLQVDLDTLRQNIALYMQLFLRIKGYYGYQADGIFGRMSRLSLQEFLKDNPLV